MASEDDDSRIVDFQPTIPASTNGSKTHRRPRVLAGVTFGFLVGALGATSLVPRLQWLNLSRVGWWGRPILAALAAGIMVGLMQQGSARRAAAVGSLAALLSLWGVYALVRLSVRVLFIDRSITQVVVGDLTRLALYAIPAGALGAASVWLARSALRGTTSAGPTDG